MNKITIFTPTYNRAYILSSLYESLLCQTCEDFIWLIVDDGSSDNTKDLVDKWIKEDRIQIEYYLQKNGGKQRAFNTGVNLCNTELFFCVDSDDELLENTIHDVLCLWETYSEAKQNITGIVSLRGKDEITPMTNCFPNNIKKSRLIDLYQKLNFSGDTALIYKTNLLRKYPFIVYDDEKFMGENYVYNKIDQEGELLLLNQVIYISKYLEDGYTNNVKKLIKNNPKGYMLLNKENALYSVNFKYKYLSMLKYIIGGYLANYSTVDLCRESPNKFLFFICFIPAVIVKGLLY